MGWLVFLQVMGGSGVTETAPSASSIEYRTMRNRLHYRALDQKPEFAGRDNELDYRAGGNQ